LNQPEADFVNSLYQTRDQYRANAERAIASGEYRKASELLWGALTQQLKAFAATRNILITSHRQFFELVRELATEMKEKSIYEDFVSLNALHKNFYDEIIPNELFPDFYEKTIRYIARLDELTRSPKV